MPSKPKPKQTATGKMVVPNNKAKSKVYTPKQFKKERLKKYKKPSKDSMGYSGVTRT